MNQVSAPPVTQNKKKRLGLMKARIGSRHTIKGPDGINRSFTVREKQRYTKVKSVCVCLNCKKTWDTEDELVQAHPETAVMRKQDEVHVYAWWSVESIDAKTEKDPKTEKDSKNIDWGRIVGLISDEE